jgi:integrase
LILECLESPGRRPCRRRLGYLRRQAEVSQDSLHHVPVKIAQEQLGHASISTTLNIYTHVVDASHR